MNEEIEEILHRENLKLASISKRSTAFFIDDMLLSILLVIAMWDSFSNATSMEEMIMLTNHVALEYMAIKIFYQAFFTMKYGASVGKLLMKIRVIELKTLDNPNVLSSLNRAIFRVISEVFFYLGFVWGMMSPTKQTLHDKTARTIVVDA